MLPRPPRSPLFPYTTLFRSRERRRRAASSRAWPRRKLLREAPTSTGRPIATSSASRASSSKDRSEEHTSELQSLRHLVCRLLLEKKKQRILQAQQQKIASIA